MYIQQSDLFEGMEREFIKKVMEIAEKETLPEGRVLFHEGAPAHYFYVLLKGRVKLDVADSGQVHVVSHPGEAFGWSSLVRRDTYSASAVCIGETRLIRFERTKFEAIIDHDPANGLIFFRRLARLLGNRLTQTYGMISASSRAATAISYGTGQTVETHLNA
ncbi:MAG: hypothetical protein AUK55_12365 [Syntrophobacteraceae bacterium CG2_30_61_12]|nr:MAG: hypothetical protein AUK55_12365 [Syntrophobacteraceae bacterium CG2_30_61_12]PIU30796.1 MAG: hypothetical protein COT06_11635 [Syntrophobacteraceae bacterium CG07_land_8_20_14_0_80_61_8]